MPQQYIDFSYVKANAAFPAILAHYNITFSGAGPQVSVVCPFHRDSKPSCRVNLERKVFNCFGCGAHGNLLEFVALAEGDGDDLRAAAIKIAEICSIETAPPREERAKGARKPHGARKGPRTGKASSEAESAPVAASAASDEPVNPPLRFTLKLDDSHPYLDERGLSADLIRTFGLGYCSRGSLAGRICIPIHNEKGELVAYAGRWPGDDDIPEGEDKYKLPAKFQKSRVLFNLNRLAGMVEHIVLVEGYWSVFRLHALGVPVAGLMGWSISPEQIALLQARRVTFVTLLFDGDDAGRRAREKALTDLAGLFFVQAPLLPDGQKPDTLPEGELLDLVRFPPLHFSTP